MKRGLSRFSVLMVVSVVLALMGQTVNMVSATSSALPAASAGNYGIASCSSAADVESTSVTPSLTRVAHFHGYTHGVALDGNNKALIGAGNELLSLDLTTTPPTKLSGVLLPQGTERAVISGTLAFVGEGWQGGLQIVDKSDLTHLKTVGSLVIGTHWVIDLAPYGNLLYLASYSNDIPIVNVQNPASPSLVGTIPISGTVQDLTVGKVGSSTYLFTVGSSGFNVYNLANSTNPSFVAHLNLAATGNSINLTNDGQYAYVTTNGAGLYIINLSNPANPTIAGTYGTCLYLYDAVPNGNRLYLAVANVGTQILDITNKANPTLLGAYTDTIYSYQIAVNGTKVHLASGYKGIEILDASNAANPVKLTGYGAGGDQAITLSSDGKLAYVGMYGAVHIKNVSNSSYVTEVGSYKFGITPTSDYANDLKLKGNNLLVAAGDQGFISVNVSNVTTPTLTSTYNPGGGLANSVDISGTLAYLGYRNNGFCLADVSNSGVFSPYGCTDTPSYAQNVAPYGQYALIADYQDWVLVYDVSNPASPVYVGTYVSDADITWVAVDTPRSLAFAGDRAGFVHILNITDPAAPALVKKFKTSSTGAVMRILVGKDGYLYVSTDDNLVGLVILDVKDPPNTKEIWMYREITAYGVGRAGLLLYLTSFGNGVDVFLDPTAITSSVYLPTFRN